MGRTALWGGALVGLTLVRLAVAAAVPLSPDEAYYWIWSRALAPGYLDHPPMVALWIWIGTALAGDGAFGVRLLAPLAAALGSLLLVQAGEDLFPGRRAGLLASVLLNATLLFGVGAVTMTPDTPLLFFWTACLCALARLHRTGAGLWWLAAGLAAGLAMASKYTAILLPLGVGLWTLCLPGPRRWLRGPFPWLGALLAVLVFLPVLMWNAAHGWASFAKQGGRGFVWHPVLASRYLGELIGGQFGLATPLVFLLCVAGIIGCARSAWRSRAAAEGLVAALTVPPVLLFLQHALGDRVQANWPTILYPAAALGATTLGARWARLSGPAVILGAALTALVYLQATLHPLPLSAHLDPTTRLIGWTEFADDFGRMAQAQGASFVTADNYGVAALLAHADLPLPVIGPDPRWRLFDLPDAAGLAARRGLLVRAADRSGSPGGWQEAVLLGQITRHSRTRTLEVFQVYRVKGGSGVLIRE